jgi:hypothetical protein
MSGGGSLIVEMGFKYYIVGWLHEVAVQHKQFIYQGVTESHLTK